ncbi:gp16 family protein [Ralstonia syzygii]|uniref:gp16 family protein n=1 Tax=Ralstonia syzygii TaxID=28097 RepID=UPI0018D19794|nr:regulatory protein GemA [Ralstonia syzygii]
MADRQQFIRLIHVAKRDLAMDDDTYRSILLQVGKKASAADLSIPELKKVLEHLKRCGFKVRSKQGARRQADDDQSKMIRGLWLELAGRGVVHNASEEALAAFVKRMTGVDALQWLSAVQASRVIEHLKKWRNRTTETA